MPTYQYACRTCDHRMEAVQSFADEPLTECPECGGPLRKVFSAVGVVFKGSGFYRNDSRPKVSAGSGSDGDSGKGSSTEKKSEAGGKPEKSDSKAPAAATPAGPSTSGKSDGSGSSGSGSSSGSSGSSKSSGSSGHGSSTSGKASTSKSA